MLVILRVKNYILDKKNYNQLRWKTNAKGRLIQVRFVPRGCNYVMEIVTEIEVSTTKDFESKRIASIDLGE